MFRPVRRHAGARWTVLVLALNPVAFGSGAAFAFERGGTHRIVKSGDAGTCMRAADDAPLAALPRERVLAFIDAGPLILTRIPLGGTDLVVYHVLH